MQEQARPLEMGEELVPEPDALARTLDQSRDVGDGQLRAVRRLDRAEHRRERRERVVGDLRLRVREPAQERRLAGVRQPGDAPRRRAASAAARPRPPRPAPPPRRSAAPGASASRSARCRALRRPPRARTTRAPGTRQVGDQLPLRRRTPACPTGTAELDRLAVGAVLARAAAGFAAAGLEPRPASRKRGEVAQRGSATSTTSPPRPPSPPSGPPFGTCFSRRKLSPPSPPRPAGDLDAGVGRGTRPGSADSRLRGFGLLGGLGHRDEALLAARRNSTVPSRTAKIVSSRPMSVPGAGPEPRAALADDDHARP